MSQTTQHEFAPEEVMAYLDGELDSARAAALAGHLEHCDGCSAVAAEFRRLSGRLLDFQIDGGAKHLDERVLDELSGVAPATARKANAEKPRRWRLAFASPYTWALAGVLIVALVVRFGIPNLLLSHKPTSAATEPVNTFDIPYLAKMQSAPIAKATAGAGGGGGEEGAIEAPQPTGPMIAQTASLTIIANNYDEASGSLGRLAASEGGYVQKLDAQATPDTPRQISATVRVPAKQLAGFLAELHKLGRVQQESQANEEVTDQYVDLQARLKSARASEQRMLQLLATRTGKLEDVLDAERELARIRGEIESMEGQRNLFAHRVEYATVDVRLQEEYRAKLDSASPSARTRIWNAAVEGYGNFADGVMALLIFLLNYGMSIVFWCAIVMVPAGFVWRWWRSRA
ncbi:MAG TPA: DUF4349 domain-containing protein [Candidatus Acidoferrum sp.]|nr:DUF4349 domain-containing protein [Candidatus Acidoferrum sp.]